jgi:hypothetical protein
LTEVALELWAQGVERVVGDCHDPGALLAADVFAPAIIDRSVQHGATVELEDAADLPVAF